MRKRHPLNVAGPFYVEESCCTSCGIPQGEAPGFLAELHETADGHCFVKRQPRTDRQIDEAIVAMAVAEFECIRYAGNDLEILAKIRRASMTYRDPRLPLRCDVYDGSEGVEEGPWER